MTLVIPVVCSICKATCVVEPCPGSSCWVIPRAQEHLHYHCSETCDHVPFVLSAIKRLDGSFLAIAYTAKPQRRVG